MAETEKKGKPFKGGSKGGTRFPRVHLAQALEYSEKLVRKTHNAPQPEQTILVGVFGNKGPEGQVRASALKQYGLLEGETDAYTASQLARDAESTPAEERLPLIQRAFLTPKLFRQMYDTFQGDTVTRAKLRQAAITGKVHPDSGDVCVECFVEGAVKAGLATLGAGDTVTVGQAAPVDTNEALDTVTEDTGQELSGTDPPESATESTDGDKGTQTAAAALAARTSSRHADVKVNLNVDSSSDPDKLLKQLELLRKFGVI